MFANYWLITSMFISLVAHSLGCKPQQQAETSSASDRVPATQATAQNKQSLNNKPADTTTRRSLSAEQWLTKQNINKDEELTVDAILESLRLYDQRAGRPEEAARWAERNLQILDLSSKNLTNVSPILAFKNISTLSVNGNKFSQPQIDELVKSLPNLRILVTDPGLNCDAKPKVTCLN